MSITEITPQTAEKTQEATGLERAVSLFLAAGASADWEVVATRMFRALRGKGTECRWDLAPEVISTAVRLGYQVLFHEDGVTLKRNPDDPRDTWGFATVKMALLWLKHKEDGRL